MLNVTLFNPNLLLDAAQTSFFLFFLPFVIFDYLYYLEVVKNGEEGVISTYVSSDKANLYTLIKLLILNIVVTYAINLYDALWTPQYELKTAQ